MLQSFRISKHYCVNTFLSRLSRLFLQDITEMYGTALAVYKQKTMMELMRIWDMALQLTGKRSTCLFGKYYVKLLREVSSQVANSPSVMEALSRFWCALSQLGLTTIRTVKELSDIILSTHPRDYDFEKDVSSHFYYWIFVATKRGLVSKIGINMLCVTRQEISPLLPTTRKLTADS